MAAFPSRDRAAFDAHWAKIRAGDGIVSRAVLADGVVAGGVNGWVDDGQWLVGYWIGREHWGRGVATRALEQFLTELTDRPLWAHVAVHNVGSARVLEKCGFRLDHVLEVDGVVESIFVLTG
jgi:RimJ/RimL family protein N-acetyltransferase